MESSSGPQPPRLSAAELYMQININFVQALQARDIVAASRACDQLAQLMPTHPNVIEFRTIIAEHAQTIAARKQQKHSKRGRNATVVAAAAATSSSSSGSRRRPHAARPVCQILPDLAVTQPPLLLAAGRRCLLALLLLPVQQQQQRTAR